MAQPHFVSGWTDGGYDVIDFYKTGVSARMTML